MGINENLRAHFPQEMTQAGFIGVAWYIVIELNLRLWIPHMRRKSLYFWSCFLATLGVFTQPLMVILVDYDQIHNLYAGTTLIYLSWCLMVIPQSLVLYSRLHLISSWLKYPRYVLYMIITTSIFICIPTMGLGIAAQGTRTARLVHAYTIWDKIQVTIFFLQETTISILYIFEARTALTNHLMLSGAKDTRSKAVRQVMQHLIMVNIFIILLDLVLLGLSYSPLFFVMGAYKPCVYGVKLRIEFSILNRLVRVFRSPLQDASSSDGQSNLIIRQLWGSSAHDGVLRVESLESGGQVVDRGYGYTASVVGGSKADERTSTAAVIIDPYTTSTRATDGYNHTTSSNSNPAPKPAESSHARHIGQSGHDADTQCRVGLGHDDDEDVGDGPEYAV